MELKILFKNSSYLVVTQIVKFIVGLIRSKLVAVFLGTSGAGIIAQLLQINHALTQITLMGMNNGLVKEIAGGNKDKNDFKLTLLNLLKSYLVLLMISLLLVLSLSILFSDHLTIFFFGDTKYNTYFLIGLASFPILVMNSISFAILKSFKQIKYIARSELIVLTLNIIFFVVLIYFFGLLGAVISVTISLVIKLIVNHYFAQTKIMDNYSLRIKDIIKGKIEKKAIKTLMIFAGLGLTTGILIMVTDSATRAIVVNKLGIEEIGLYTPVLTWSNLFTQLLLPSIGLYLYPRFCEIKSNAEINGLFNDAIKFVTILMIPFILLCIPIRYQIIPIFYSQEFINAGNYLPWHFFGTLFFLWLYPFNQAMPATGRIKTYGVITVIMCAIDFSIVYFMVPIIGLYGWMLKFIISPVIFFFFYLFYFKRKTKLKIESSNLTLMSYSVFSFLVLISVEQYLSTTYIVNFMIGILLTGFTFFVLSSEEKKIVANFIRQIFK